MNNELLTRRDSPEVLLRAKIRCSLVTRVVLGERLRIHVNRCLQTRSFRLRGIDYIHVRFWSIAIDSADS